MTRPAIRWAAGAALTTFVLIVAPSPAPADAVGTDGPGCDFNGDGFEDLVLPVPGEGLDGAKAAGAVNVLYGSKKGFSRVGDLLVSQDTPGVPDKPEPGDRLGTATACGDIDGDGRDDLVVGAPGEAVVGKEGAGAISVVYGSEDGLDAGDFWNQHSPGFPGAAQKGAALGWSLAVCDFDGDGRDDVALGSPGATVAGQKRAGRVHILYGKASGLASNGAEVYNQQSVGMPGTAMAADAFGHALACGDFDGDGRADLAIGTPFDLADGVRETGSVSIVWGAKDGTKAKGDRFAQGLDGVPGLAEIGDAFGYSVTVGDFDGDGLDDLAVGAPRESVGLIYDAGAVTVLYGDPDRGLADRTWLRTRAAPGIEGTARTGDRFGASLASGDFGGNGRSDLAVGSPGQKVNGFLEAGAVNVIYGKASGLTAKNDIMITQATPGVPGKAATSAHFGWSLNAVDPVGSGRARLVTFAPGASVAEKPDAGLAVITLSTGGALDPATSHSLHQDSDGVAGTAEKGDDLGRDPDRCDPLDYAGCGHPVCPISIGSPTGSLDLIPGTTAAWGTGTLKTYAIQVEHGLGIDADCFADSVQGILSDSRSWVASGEVSFQRVPYSSSGLQIILASPAKVDDLCYPLATGGTLSCRVGSKVVINAVRWRDGVTDFAGDLRSYQGYLINHEVGHGLGQSHRYCPGSGQPAPVMMQQSKGVGVCLPNPWPRPYEIADLDLGAFTGMVDGLFE